MPAGSPLTACGDRLQRASSGFLDSPVKPENDNYMNCCLNYYENINSSSLNRVEISIGRKDNSK
jgi:hypothetical protein